MVFHPCVFFGRPASIWSRGRYFDAPLIMKGPEYERRTNKFRGPELFVKYVLLPMLLLQMLLRLRLLPVWRTNPSRYRQVLLT
jgi:hypothetical protein